MTRWSKSQQRKRNEGLGSPEPLTEQKKTEKHQLTCWKKRMKHNALHG